MPTGEADGGGEFTRGEIARVVAHHTNLFTTQVIALWVGGGVVAGWWVVIGGWLEGWLLGGGLSLVGGWRGGCWVKNDREGGN